ncbi:MAG: hypothetical protein ACUVX1_05205 [Chloroflexota bacterium]
MDQQPRRDEKEEKGRGEKREKEEKGRPGDALSGIMWGAVLVVAGLIFLAGTLGFLPGFTAGQLWGFVFLAAGVIFLLEVVIRLSVAAYRRPVTGTLIFAFILLAVGVGLLIGFQNVWPLILIGIGIIILVGQFLRR